MPSQLGLATSESLKPMNRPATYATNRTLRSAAVQSLYLQQMPGLDKGDMPQGPLSARTADTPLSVRSPISAREPFSPRSSTALMSGLPAGKATKVKPNRCPPRSVSEGWGKYRPAVTCFGRDDTSGLWSSPADKEFHDMLELIGQKCAEKFSKARTAFRFIDGDHDGTVSRSEVQFFFRFFNIEPEKADKFFDRLDSDGSGSVSNLEFIKYLWPYINPGDEQGPLQLGHAEKEDTRPEYLGAHRKEVQIHRLLSGKDLPPDLRAARMRVTHRMEVRHTSLRKAFLELDKDQDGYIQIRDIRDLFATCGEGLPDQLAQSFFDFVDTDHSGSISFQEFGAIFHKDMDGFRIKNL